MRMQKCGTLAILAVVFVLAACTRPEADPNSSRISISLPGKVSNKVGAQAAPTNAYLIHLVVNVSGPGIVTPMIKIWDNCHNCSAATLIQNTNDKSTEFVDAVPTGSNRLIQVLAVYKDIDTNGMTFYYGDGSANLVGAVENVDITVSKVGSGAAALSGNVQGRYFTSAGAGPTGAVNIKFYPGAGKPSLIIDRSLMTNGWFNFFMLDGVDFQYEVEGASNLLLWGGPVNLSSPALAGSNAVLKAALPISDRNQTNSWVHEDPRYFVYGWFGDATAVGSKVVNRPGTLSALTKVKQYNTTPGSGSALTGSVVAAMPTSAELFATAPGLSHYYLSGGVAGTCSAANNYSSCLDFQTSFIDGNGGDGASILFGPLQSVTSNGYQQAFTSSSIDSTHYRMTAKLLPGLASTVIDNLIVYKTTQTLNDNSVVCSEIVGGSGGYQQVATTSTFDANAQFTVDLPLTATELSTSSTPTFAVCFAKSGTVYPAGIVLRGYQFGSGMALTATSIAFDFPKDASGGIGKAQTGYCIPVKVVGMAGSQVSNLPTGTVLTFSKTNMGTYTEGASSCPSGSFSGSPQTVSGSEFLFWIRGTADGAGTLSVTANNGLTPPSTLNLTFAQLPSTKTQKAVFITKSSILAHTCYEVSSQSWIFDTNVAGDPGMLGVFDSAYQFDWPTTSGFHFYPKTNPNCDDDAGNEIHVSLDTSNVTRRSYFKYTGTASQINLVPTPDTFTGSIIGTTNIQVTQPGPVAKVSLQMATSAEQNECIAVSVATYDSAWHSSAVASSKEIDLVAGSGGQFYDGSSNCTTSPVSSVTLGSGESFYGNIYYKNIAQGTKTVSATINGTAISQAFDFTVAPGLAAAVYAVFPGQSWVEGTGVSGVPNPQKVGQSFSVSLYAANTLNKVDTTYNGNKLASLNSPSGDLGGLNFSAVNFVSGVATFSVNPIAPTEAATLGGLADISASHGYSVSITSSGPVILPVADRLKIYMSSAHLKGSSTCQIFMVTTEDAMGAAGIASGVTASVASSGGSGTIYTDSGCNSVLTGGNLNLSPSQTGYVLFYKFGISSGTDTITVSDGVHTAATPMSVTIDAGSPGSYTVNTRVLGPSAPQAANHLRCNPYVVYVDDGSGLMKSTSTAVLSLGLSGAGIGEIYSNSACTAVMSPRTIGLSGTGYSMAFVTSPAFSGNTEYFEVTDSGTHCDPSGTPTACTTTSLPIVGQ